MKSLMRTIDIQIKEKDIQTSDYFPTAWDEMEANNFGKSKCTFMMSYILGENRDHHAA